MTWRKPTVKEITEKQIKINKNKHDKNNKSPELMMNHQILHPHVERNYQPKIADLQSYSVSNLCKLLEKHPSSDADTCLLQL